EERQGRVRRLTGDEEARLRLVFLSKPEAPAARYEITLDASGAILLKPRQPGSDLAWVKISVAPSATVDTLSYEDASGNRTEFRFEGWKVEKARPPTDYRITGPTGTRIVEN